MPEESQILKNVITIKKNKIIIILHSTLTEHFYITFDKILYIYFCINNDAKMANVLEIKNYI